MTNLFNTSAGKERRRLLRKTETETEGMLWSELRGAKLGTRFRRQFGIGHYVVDFYAPKARLVIEIDGSIHDQEETKENDRERQVNLEALGLRVLRFTVREIHGNMDAVLSRIRFSITLNPLLTKERAG